MKKLISFLLILAMLSGMSCAALAAPGSSEQKKCSNENLENFTKIFNSILEEFLFEAELPIDYVACSGTIKYDENSFNYGDTGIGVVSGGAYSVNNTISLGTGTGLDEDQDYWYVSLTFSPEVSDDSLITNSFAFILTCCEMGMKLANSQENYANASVALSQMLLSEEEPIAIESNGMVLLHKNLGSGIHLLALDSVEYYDEFYYNDIENYIVLD